MNKIRQALELFVDYVEMPFPEFQVRWKDRLRMKRDIDGTDVVEMAKEALESEDAA